MIFEQCKYPSTWKLESIKDAYIFTSKPRGLNIKEMKNIPFYPMDCIPFDKLFPSEPLQKDGSTITSGTYIENGDLLLAKITPSFENGKQAIAKLNCDFGYASTEIIPIKKREGVSDIWYLFYILKNTRIRKYLAGKMEGSTGRQRLNENILAEFKIPLPPLPEKRKIATILSTIQKAIETQGKLIENTTELKKAMMHKLFSEGTRGEKQKMTEIGLVPESWEVVELGKFAMIKNGYAFKSKDYINKGILSVRISNVSHGVLIDKDNKYLPETYLNKYSEYALQAGDLILSLTRPIISSGMKYCFIKEENLPLLLNQRVGKFEVKDSNKLFKGYLFYIIFSNYFTKELKKLFGNSSQQPNVSPIQLDKFLISLPILEEQKEIAIRLSALDNKIDYHIRKKQKLEELFRTLLYQLMTAEVRVDGMEIESLLQYYSDNNKTS